MNEPVGYERRLAIDNFKLVTVPGTLKYIQRGHVIPKQDEQKILDDAKQRIFNVFESFKYNTASIRNVLAVLFRYREHYVADVEFAGLILRQFANTQYEHMSYMTSVYDLDDNDDVFEDMLNRYAAKDPSSLPEMLKSDPKLLDKIQARIFGSPQRYAMHIQWAYDTFLVPKGFKKRDLFNKNQAAYWPQLGDDMQKTRHAMIQDRVSSDIQPLACDACGTTITDNDTHAQACACKQCGVAMYCGRACQEADWTDGKHALNCWDASTRNPDLLSQWIVTDLNTRHTDCSTFSTTIGQPLDQTLVKSAPIILMGLRDNVPQAIDTAHMWLANARHNHVGTGLENMSHVDLLDTMEDLAERQHMALPGRLEDILDAYDIHATLTPDQRQQVSQYVGQMALDMRQYADIGLKGWVDKRRKEFGKWRGKRRDRINDLQQRAIDMETELVKIYKELAEVRRFQYFKRRKYAKWAAETAKRLQ